MIVSFHDECSHHLNLPSIFSYSNVFEFCLLLCHSDNSDSTSILESSLSTKEKLISELNMELHNIETTLTNEREQHINEIKKLNILLNEKVWHFILLLLVQCLSRDINPVELETC